jgi:hypothetical protein
MKAMFVVNLVTHKAAAEHEHFFNKPDYDHSLVKAPVIS